MDKEIHDLYSLCEIFKDKKFLIPDYQRGYSWEVQQRNDLIEDIKHLRGSNYHHFTGTIVAASPNNDQCFEIVDGQQRLTTIILLLSTIYHSNPAQFSDIKNDFLFSGEETGNTQFKLKLNGELDEMFKEVLTKNQLTINADTKSKQNLESAFNELREWVVSQSEDELDETVKALTSELGFLFYTPRHNNEIGIMFEVINNRGKKLSELEKVKNYLMYSAAKGELSDLHDCVDKNWGAILTNLSSIHWHSNESEDAFLRNCWIVFKDPSKKKSHHVYYYLKEEYPVENVQDHWQDLISFVEFMVAASVALNKLFSKNSDGVYMQLSNHSSNASVLPIYLAIELCTKDGQLKEKCLSLLEKLNFRYYVSNISNRADSGQGTLFWNAFIFFNNYEKSFSYSDSEHFIDEKWLSNRLISFIEQRANDTSFVQALTLDKDESGDYYKWPGVKYFLACYENFLASKKGRSFNIPDALKPKNSDSPNDFYHKEHIWARQEYSLLDDSLHPNVNKRRLGNFILLKQGLNIKVSNDPVKEKVNQYRIDSKEDLNTRMLLETSKIYDQECKKEKEKWSRKTSNFFINVNIHMLDKREEKMVNFALDRWRVNELNKKVLEVKIDSFKNTNEVFELKYDNPVVEEKIIEN